MASQVFMIMSNGAKLQVRGRVIVRVRVTCRTTERCRPDAGREGGREGGLGELLRKRGHVNAYVIG